MFKEKKNGGNKVSPLSSFNEKMETCFRSELPGLTEAQGSGQDAGLVGIGSQGPRGAAAADKLLGENVLLHRVKTCMQIKCFIREANHDVYRRWAWLSAVAPLPMQMGRAAALAAEGQRDLESHSYGLSRKRHLNPDQENQEYKVSF